MIDKIPFKVQVMALAMSEVMQKEMAEQLATGAGSMIAHVFGGDPSSYRYGLTPDIIQLLGHPEKGYKYTTNNFLYFWRYEEIYNERREFLIKNGSLTSNDKEWQDFQSKKDTVSKTLACLTKLNVIQDFVQYITSFNQQQYRLQILYTADNEHEQRLLSKGSLMQHMFSMDFKFDFVSDEKTSEDENG